jgi:hypothetical protein
MAMGLQVSFETVRFGLFYVCMYLCIYICVHVFDLHKDDETKRMARECMLESFLYACIDIYIYIYIYIYMHTHRYI